jgi:hypothetical protein
VAVAAGEVEEVEEVEEEVVGEVSGTNHRAAGSDPKDNM